MESEKQNKLPTCNCQFHVRVNDVNHVAEFSVFSWTKDEYLRALSVPIFQDSVKSVLDAAPGTELRTWSSKNIIMLDHCWWLCLIHVLDRHFRCDSKNSGSYWRYFQATI